MDITDVLVPAKYRYCSKHIIVMTWFDQDVRKAVEETWRYSAISGFAMSFEDRWFLATAGHIVESPPQKCAPVIYAQVRDSRVTNVAHVDGFSGSPVFGMGPKRDDGTTPYRVIAMQYAWSPDKRVIVASPIRTFARLFSKHLAKESPKRA